MFVIFLTLLTIGLEPIPYKEQILSLSCIPISPSKLIRVKGIEPMSSVWKTDNLPLIYTRNKLITQGL